MSEVAHNIELFIDGLDEDVIRGLEYVLQAIENEAKERCPVDDGTLRASITHQIDGYTGIVGTNMEYAPYVHEGTGIYAKNGKGRQQVPWYFPVDDGGKLASRYNMPIITIKGREFYKTWGQKLNPFLREAVESLQGQLMTLAKEGMQN